MIKMKLHPTVIFRIPKFSYEERFDNNWSELKNMIKDASPEFFQLIEPMSLEDLAKAEKKIQLTAKKYFNRSAFRSTPFGTFASVGIAQLESKTSTLEINGEQVLHSFTDWTFKSKIEFEAKELLQPDVLFFANTTYYQVQNEMRFIQKVGDNFEMTAIDFDPVVKKILAFLNKPKSYQTIIDKMKFDFNEATLNEYLEDLISIQLIFTSKQPNIIGEDYFKRIGKVEKFGEVRYIIPQTKITNGSFEKDAFKHLPDLVSLLGQIVPPYVEPDLEDFKMRFLRRFEQAEIQIMEALDPEKGIGYGNLTVAGATSAIIQKLTSHSENRRANTYNSNVLKEKLCKALVNHPKVPFIDLNEFVPEDENGTILPNSLSAVCTIANDLLFLEHIGGATATAVAGRFGLAIPEIETYCKEIAVIEQEANPEVLFFDIGYTKEDRVDNINRRPAIYNLQLNLLNYDTSTAPLSLNDIYISIQRNEVILRSIAHNKRLVPRIASAYNAKRSDLALFRFLVDIQNQGIHTNLQLRPANLIPDLDYYPRLQFRNIVVSPATWLLNREVYNKVEDYHERILLLQQHLLVHLPVAHYKVGSGDQTLCLAINSSADTDILYSLLEKAKVLYVEEAIIPISSVVNDQSRKPYIPQLVITIYHQGKIIEPLSNTWQSNMGMAEKQWITPGKHWLFFEIYCSPRRTDYLLDEKIKPYLNSFQDKIKRWFFIRYSEGGEHIRLRVELHELNDSAEMTSALPELLKKEVQSGLVTDIKLCTYKKEVHRYSTALMDEVETHFEKDSRFVIQMLAVMLDDMAKYKLCLDVFETVETSGLLHGKRMEDIMSAVKNSLDKEHRIDVTVFKEINKLYKVILDLQAPTLTKFASKLHRSLKSSFIGLLEKCEVEHRQKLFADLMHMHVNRLFTEDQRTHETLVYHFGLLDHKRRKYRPAQMLH